MGAAELWSFAPLAIANVTRERCCAEALQSPPDGRAMEILITWGGYPTGSTYRTFQIAKSCRLPM